MTNSMSAKGIVATIRVPRKGNGERCFRSELPLSVPSCHQLLDAGRTQTPPLCLVSASKPVWKACVRTSVLPSRGNRDHILHGWLWACSHAECLSKSNESPLQSGAAQNQFLAARCNRLQMTCLAKGKGPCILICRIVMESSD